jgi:hypothetical protein
MNRRKTGEAETILSHLVKKKGRKEKTKEKRKPFSVSRE